MAAELAPEVTVVPVLQHWTFEPLRVDDIDPTAWIVREATVHGVDVYNAWSPTNGKEWRSFGSRADEVLRLDGRHPDRDRGVRLPGGPRQPGPGGRVAA